MFVSQSRAIEILNQNKIVALPTETVYGLAARYDSEEALLQIFKTKKRPSFDPLIVHISRKEQLEVLTRKVQPVESFLMDQLWPGPLTFVLPKHPSVNPIITSGLDFIAVRMPQHPLFTVVIDHTAPLAAPSANLFGHTSPTTAQHVDMEFSGEVPICDGGATTVGIESSVIQISEADTAIQLHIHRPGMITEEVLKTTLLNYTSKEIKITYGATKASPGHIADHYQPRKPLVVVQNNCPITAETHHQICNFLKLSFSSSFETLNYSDKEPTHVARILYSDLHRLSYSPTADYILLVVNTDFLNDSWRALRDRIEKASTLSITFKDGTFFTHNKLKNFQ